MWTLAFRSASVWMVWKLCCWAACRCCFASQPAWCRSIFQPPPGELGFFSTWVKIRDFGKPVPVISCWENGWRLVVVFFRSRGIEAKRRNLLKMQKFFGFTWLQGNTKNAPKELSKILLIIPSDNWNGMIFFWRKHHFFFNFACGPLMLQTLKTLALWISFKVSIESFCVKWTSREEVGCNPKIPRVFLDVDFTKGFEFTWVFPKIGVPPNHPF